jgi:adenylosuccinate lyase
VIRRHSLAVAEAVSRGEPNDLLRRLASEAGFRGVGSSALQAELEPANYTGRAQQQVSEFVEEYLQPLLTRARPLAAEAEAAEVVV